jgi:hypothetical protein
MKKGIEEWIERGEHDLEAARLLLDREARSDVVLFRLESDIANPGVGGRAARRRRDSGTLPED